MYCRSVCIWTLAIVVAAIQLCDSELWCCVGGVCRDWKGKKLASDLTVIRPLSKQKPPHFGHLSAVTAG